MNDEAAKRLREPFPPEQVGKLPRAGTTLDYVGHAAVTDRLLEVDPEWAWEPVAFDEDGAPLIKTSGENLTLWIRLTVAGTTRYGVGIVPAKAFEREKQLISDAIRNAAMRFGVALDLWSRQDLDGATAPAGVDHRTGEIVPIDDVDALKPRDLHAALSARGLDATGTVEAMRARLREATGTGEPQRGDGHADATPAPPSGMTVDSPVPGTLPGVAADREAADRADRGTSSAVTSREPTPGTYSGLKRIDLIAMCGERRLDVPSNITVADLIEVLEADDRRQASV